MRQMARTGYYKGLSATPDTSVTLQFPWVTDTNSVDMSAIDPYWNTVPPTGSGWNDGVSSVNASASSVFTNWISQLESSLGVSARVLGVAGGLLVASLIFSPRGR